MSIKVLQIARESGTVVRFLMPLIQTLGKRGWEVHIAAGGTRNVKMLEASGHPFHRLPYRRPLTPWAIAKICCFLFRLFWRERFDLVVTHTAVLSVLVRLVRPFTPVRALVYTSHGLPFVSHQGKLKYAALYLLERVMATMTTGILVMNREDARVVKKWQGFLGPKNTRFFHGVGVDCDLYEKPLQLAKAEALRKQLGIPANRLVFAYLGRFWEAKGVLNVLQASVQVKQRAPNVHFLLVGSGPAEDKVRQFCSQAGIADIVSLPGYRTDCDDIIRIIDVLVLPTWYPEGLPRSILEAMAAGKAVITTTVRGCVDLIEDGETGVLVPPHDVEALADAIVKLADNRELAQQFGAKAQQVAKQEYSQDRTIEEQISFYKDVLEDRGRRR